MSRHESIIILLLFPLFYGIFGLSICETPTYDTLRLIGGVGLAQFVFSIYSSIKNRQKLISPYIVFLVVMFIFHTGQSLMYTFDIRSKNDLIGFYGITIRQIFEAQLISFSFLAFFQIGALMCRPFKYKEEIQSFNSRIQTKRLKQIGLFLAIISVYPYYKELINNVLLSLLYGYGALYEGKAKIGLDNISGLLADYFIPSLICLYIAYRQKKVPRLIITGILLFNCTVILATGGRTEAVIILALLLILRNYLVKSFRKMDLAIIGICGVMILEVLAGISGMRSQQYRNFSDTFELSNDKNSTPGADALGEMGISMFCQIWTQEILSRSEEYRYGSTYAYAMTSIVPNLGFWKIHPAKLNANMSDWLTDEKGLRFGTGYSMVAEAYANFWLFGALWMIILGYLASMIFSRLGNAVSSRNIAFVAFILVFFWFSLKIPRNSFIGVVRAIFYFALPIYWWTRGYIFKTKR